MSKNNLALLNAIVDEYSKNNFSDDVFSKDQVFEIFATDVFFSKYDFSIDDIKSGLVGGRKDWGIDGFYILIDGKSVKNIEDVSDLNPRKNFSLDLYVFQYKNTKTFKENVIEKFLTIIKYIADMEQPEYHIDHTAMSEDLIEAIKLFHQIILKSVSKHPTVNMTFIHASRGDTESVSTSYMTKIQDLREAVEYYSLGRTTNFDYKLLGAEELKNMAQYQKSYSANLRLSESPIFVEYGTNQVQKGYIATVYLKDYFEFLTEEDETTGEKVLREYLFESNIRDYQNRTAVNKDIEKTLRDPQKANDFWWLNNGVTILAEEGAPNGKNFQLDNIQIVNGLQTSHSIYYALKNSSSIDDRRTLFCKIIITQDEISRNNIIKATNFQNSVPASSLRSTDIIQRDIETFLFQKGIYYDRRKNFYKNKGKPLNKIISINYLAQALTAILLDNPSKARTSPTVLTKKDDDYNKIFNKKTNIEVYYHVALLRQVTEKYIKNQFKKTEDSIKADITNYFQLHLLRIVASIITNSKDISRKSMTDISENDIKNIPSNVIDTAINFLEQIIKDNYIENGEDNLANISKNQSINTQIIENIETILN